MLCFCTLQCLSVMLSSKFFLDFFTVSFLRQCYSSEHLHCTGSEFDSGFLEQINFVCERFVLDSVTKDGIKNLQQRICPICNKESMNFVTGNAGRTWGDKERTQYQVNAGERNWYQLYDEEGKCINFL